MQNLIIRDRDNTYNKEKVVRDLIEALIIFLKYDNKQSPTNCSHDCLFVDIQPEWVSKEDKKRLDELGFFPDEELEGFNSFKFGSC